MKRGLFCGLVTLDFIYLTGQFFLPNEKVVAEDYLITAGGPATNAAVAFSCLGNHSILLSGVGKHPMTQLIFQDLDGCGVQLIDLDRERLEISAVSSIIVTKSTGERAIISINATKSQVKGACFNQIIKPDVEVVLIDGHQLELSVEVTKFYRNKNVPVVLDGGSWKPGLEKVLPLVTYAICSEKFYPPGCSTVEEVFAYLRSLGIVYGAITRGDKSILYQRDEERGEVLVPVINKVVDTLGAGDIYHGAFCYYILEQDFVTALGLAAKVAAHSCQFFGTREWRYSIG